jgi:GTP cyclohydrolase I
MDLEEIDNFSYRRKNEYNAEQTSALTDLYRQVITNLGEDPDSEGLKKTPAADVEEVKHGRWIEDGDVQICSECGEEHEWADYRAPYCDICGAKMDGKEKTDGET